MLVAISFSLSPAADVSAPEATGEHARYVGVLSCQSSMCHGGASPLRCQYAIWSHDDAHARAYATLVSDYGINIAKAAGIASPTTDARCVACHAPLAMPGTDLAPTANAIEGVTCESCHNAAATWLRSHTRPDYTYADRVHAGLRDLRDTYVRADTCVKCHQVIAADLLKAGHPALTFELDGQTASEPRHWMEKDSWFGAKAWLVGQAVALRDISQQLATEEKQDPDLLAQQSALVWLMSEVRPVHVDAPLGTPTAQLSAQASPNAIGAWANSLAHEFSDCGWKPELTLENLSTLLATAESFTDNSIPLPDRQQRAQRLVLALDRLLKAAHPIPPANPLKPSIKQPTLPGDAELGALFNAVQDPQAFDPKKFADSLQKFAAVVAPNKN